MLNVAMILNEREARDARALLSSLEEAISSEKTFESIIAGLPPQAIDGFRKSLRSQKDELNTLLKAYEEAKSGNYETLSRKAGSDPGIALIVARIARKLSQKELARKLGLKEQQIQRYEADRYRSISLSNYQRISSVLGLQMELKLSDWYGSGWMVSQNVLASDVKKIIKHARENRWFDEDRDLTLLEEDSFNYLQRYVSEHIVKYGSPTLLRTGLNIDDHTNDFLLLAWKARVTRRAEEVIASRKVEYRPLDIKWLLELVRLSVLNDGPARAREFLASKGIVVVFEPQIQGMTVDGCAFLVGDIPVIGLTGRRDTVDNFWFTLLHEVAHVILHFRAGLASGFFDNIENADVDEMEREANVFAANILIPEERWKRTPARISKSPRVIEHFANELQIHPAVVFGRVQKERGDYRTFSNMIGRGEVRKYLSVDCERDQGR